MRITALLEDGYPANRTFFQIMLGAAKALPKLYGIEHATVTGEVSERYLRYEIRYPASSSPLSRLRRWLSRRLRTAYCAWNLANAYEQLVIRTFALGQAISAQHKMRRELVAERAAMERRMQGVSQVVVEYDHLNQVAYLSQNAERVFGYPNRVLLSEPFCILRSQDRPLAEAFFRNPKNVPDGVYPMQGIHAQGHSLNLEVAVNHFEDAQGLARWTATFRDVTQRELKPLAADVLVPAQPSDSLVAHAQQSEAADSAAQVLLFADDDEMTRRVARQILDRAGYSVDCVVDGVQALSRLPQIKADAIVLDLNMPKMSGDRVYEQLLADGSQLPVLFVSGDPESIHDRYPEVPVVSKPFRAAELVDAVQVALAR